MRQLSLNFAGTVRTVLGGCRQKAHAATDFLSKSTNPLAMKIRMQHFTFAKSLTLRESDPAALP